MVPLRETRALIHRGAGAGLFFGLLKELFVTSGDQISEKPRAAVQTAWPGMAALLGLSCCLLCSASGPSRQWPGGGGKREEGQGPGDR